MSSMDALLVFDPQNNLISFKCDQRFENYFMGFCKQNGFIIEIKDINDKQVFRNLLSVLVTPFVVSQRYLINASDVTFDCIASMNAVYSKRHEFFLLLIYNELEDKVLVQRKVNLFANIIQFIFGPLIHCLNTNCHLMDVTFKMIDEWQALSPTTTFMLESIERLLVGPDLIKICNNTLHHILSRMQMIAKFSNENISHLYLFYELKYITSYSSRKTTKISRGDMLLMVLLSHTIDKYYDTCDDDHEEQYKSIDDKLLSSFEKYFKQMMSQPVPISHTKCNHYLIFLESSKDQNLLIPYIYRRLKIDDKLFAIVLSEIPTQIASNLMVLINIINILMNESNDKKCCHTVIQLQNAIKRIKDFIFQNNLIKEKSYISTLNTLNRLNKCKIFEYLTDLDQNLLNFQTEAQLQLINNSLRDNYRTLVFDFYNNYMSRVETLHKNLFNEIIFYCKNTFVDYLGYLKVKCQRNMTLLGMDVHIKGLIGFIYIDRTVNEVIMAPIEYVNEDSGPQISPNQFNQMTTKMISHAYRCLMNGNLISIWADGVFQYSYAIWFEDSSGSSLEPRVKSFALNSFPCIISGNFIQDIINLVFCKDLKIANTCHVTNAHKSTVSCYPYELFCIYNSTLLLDEINVIHNTKNLSSKLWEIGISSEF